MMDFKIQRALVLAAGLVGVGASFTNESNGLKPVHILLDVYYDNQAFALYPGETSFDLLGNAYQATDLPPSGILTSTHSGMSYIFPGYKANTTDNAVMSGQVVIVPQAPYFSVNMLIAAEADASSGNLTFTYTDNTTTTAEIRSNPWYTFLGFYKGEIILPGYFTHNSSNFNLTNIFEYTMAVDPSKSLVSITLSDTSNDTSRLHVFSMSLFQGTGPQIQFIRPTQKSIKGIQTVEVIVNNAGPEWISGKGVEVSIEASGIIMVETATITRLRPGDQRKVDVKLTGEGNVTAKVILQGTNTTVTNTFENVTFGLAHWTEDASSLTLHESPNWFNDAKFGIFIHWGVYAVPGWGNSTPYETYAEWYWWYGHHLAADNADIYDYHLRTYGPEVVYDDFFDNFTAANWDPKEWVDLFDEAGAQYFVLTTKHHDGFALFDTMQTTNRSSINYGPKRDIVQELFDAAKTYQPHLRRGTYFSLPEWYNPDFGKYGFAQLPGNASTSWPGILANNPYTGAVESYTGRLNISDFIADLMVPQMELLAYKYETEIMWCDCGAANGTAPFAAAWYNYARTQSREVAMNGRCGIGPGSDFGDPEYTTFSSVSSVKWESSAGMDPYSYGYNRATAAASYMNASTMINNLVDIVSKNGNYLLDIGPKADGTIDATEVAALKAGGKWINANAEAIFNTTYWFITPELGENIRFTQTNDAFYILSFVKPTEKFVVDTTLPILTGDVVSMVGAGNGTVMSWKFEGGDGGIVIDVPAAFAEAGEYCWVFKIGYVA